MAVVRLHREQRAERVQLKPLRPLLSEHPSLFQREREAHRVDRGIRERPPQPRRGVRYDRTVESDVMADQHRIPHIVEKRPHRLHLRKPPGRFAGL